MEIIQYDKPVDRVRAFIRDYAQELYGITNASALMPLVEVAFDVNATNPERISASRELLKYSEVPTRAIEYTGDKTGPDLEVTILGTCEIKEPTLGIANPNTQSMVATATSDSPVELPDAGREEGS
jgi:hypothetical protein